MSLTHIVPFACRWVYEVKWRPSDGKSWPNSYEPASCLVGWEAEMAAIDEECAKQALDSAAGS